MLGIRMFTMRICGIQTYPETWVFRLLLHTNGCAVVLPTIGRRLLHISMKPQSTIDAIEEMHLQVIGCIPFENIIAYDADGDEYYLFPHLYCDFPNGSDPFEAIIYLTESRQVIDKERIVEGL